MNHSPEELKDVLLQYAKTKLVGLDPGHDLNHAQRVLNNALCLLCDEPCDTQVVIAASILHDAADHKFFDEEQSIHDMKLFLKDNGFSSDQCSHVLKIITHLSFSKEIQGIATDPTVEFCIVQDADRLDAIGAIGIARAFSYGGFRQRPFYSTTEASTIDHFHEKLLLLPQMMKTQAGRKMAEERKNFMLLFLSHFDAECQPQP